MGKKTKPELKANLKSCLAHLQKLNITLSVTCQKDAAVPACHKVGVNVSSVNREEARWELWLAREREAPPMQAAGEYGRYLRVEKSRPASSVICPLLADMKSVFPQSTKLCCVFFFFWQQTF